MHLFVRAVVLTVALVCSAPLCAQELTASAVKAFSTRIDAAVARRDIDAVLDNIADHAVISGTVNVQGQTQTFRMGKSQYREVLKAALTAASSYSYERSNERISIEGSQAVITADVSETVVIGGQQLVTKTRERATVEYIDGKLMLTKLFGNQVL